LINKKFSNKKSQTISKKTLDPNPDTIYPDTQNKPSG